MNGIRFYLEHKTPKDKRKNIHAGNVVAVFVDNGILWSGKTACYESLGAVYFHENSVVGTTATSLDYLRENCKRISESKARTIHPELFKVLDDND